MRMGPLTGPVRLAGVGAEGDGRSDPVERDPGALVGPTRDGLP